MKVAIIGGGPSGLVTLKYLVTAHKFLHTLPVEVALFESAGEVGGTFAARTYEEAELVSSKQLTTFSDFRPRADDADFLSAERYVEYLKEYCTHFDLWPFIRLKTPVQSVTRTLGGEHVVSYRPNNGEECLEWRCDAIAVCSGLHVVPNIPHIPGIERVPTVMHSSEFKTRAQFGVGTTVLVLGSGETGADVAYMAVTAPTDRVVMSHRNGFHLAPVRNLNPAFFPIFGGKKRSKPTIPLDNSRASLFDTAYVHPLLRNNMALWEFYDLYVKSVLWWTTGTTAGFDQWVGSVSPEKDHVSRIFFNKSKKVGPYISAPYRKTNSFMYRLRAAFIQAEIPDTQGRHIDVAPWPEEIDSSGIVRFKDNGRPEYQVMRHEKVKPDVVMLCTGYRQEFHFLSNTRSSNGAEPYPTPNEADVRNIWKRDDPTVGFIGFVRPSLGAIPPLSEMQAQLWVLNLLRPDLIPRPLVPEDEPHYRLHHVQNSRIQYGVDQESYAYQLALDTDSALSFTEAVSLGWRKNWRLPLTWALAANLNSKFRLRGPWKWERAEEVMTGEMWNMVCQRRLFFDHFLLSFLPMLIFGPLSFLVWTYATLTGPIRRKRPVRLAEAV